MIRTPVLVASALLCVQAVFGAALADQATLNRKAVLIGIDKYQSSDIRTLQGAVNDVEAMQAVLVGKLGFLPADIVVLTNEQATRAGVLQAIRRHLIEATPPPDIALVHFSGHGSRVIDVSGEEIDSWDETLVVHDSRVGEVFDITDDEVGELLDQISRRTQHVALVIDSCHSGTITRAADASGAVARTVVPDLRRPPPAASRSTEGPLANFRSGSPRFVLISGSRSAELSNEASFDGVRHGALTYYLVQALRSMGAATTYRDLMDRVSTEVTARFPSQHPQLDGPSIDNVIFGIREIAPRAYVMVEPAPSGTAKIGAGSLLGVRPPMILNVFAPGTKEFDDHSRRIGRVRVIQAGAFDATAEVLEGRVVAASRAMFSTLVGQDEALRVQVQLDDASQRARVQGRLAEHDAVIMVPSAGDAQMRVHKVGPLIAVDGLEGNRLMAVEASAPQAADRVADAVVHWSRWYRMLSLDNPSSDLPIELRIQRADASPGDPQPDAVADKTPLTVTVANRSTKGVYVVVLGLSANGQICILFPTSGGCRGSDQQESLAPGAFSTHRIGAGVPEGAARTFDIVKVIATTQWVPPRLFELPPAPRGQEVAARGDESALERYLRGTMQGARLLEPISVDGWSVRQRRIEVYRAAQRETGFVLHFDGPASEGLERARSRTRGDCPGPRCPEVSPFRGDPTMVEVRTVVSRSPAGETLPVGQAFDEAYRLSDATGAARAEPLFAYDQAPPQHGTVDDTRGGEFERHDPRAEVDATWSLKQARVFTAWQVLRSDSGAVAGAEAAGIVIAHPDTGYLKHPEIWQADPAATPVRPDLGYDYFGEDDDPTDDLLDRQPLDNPAHGTGSGSAIISPAGCQLAATARCPTGVAAGARIIPLRVGRSVVHFDTRRMTQAILDASGPDRSHVKAKADLMSISMGGVPSWALWKAVRAAEQRGFLIIAASGNYIGTVVWPARFESVIAVAATNIACKPWPFTSMGTRIDISAPGESVWRATIDSSRAFITGMGSGTTYATANTAGIAALWVALHGETPQFQEIRNQGKTVQVFRSLLRQSATRPAAVGGTRTDCDADSQWNASLMGPGIIDAAALLAQPLLAEVTRGAPAAERLDDLPLWASVYAPGIGPSARLQDYLRLFLLDDPADLAKVARYEAEVLHHYATEPAVTRALDRLVSTGDRSDEAFRQLRAALRQADLSNRLRETLPTV